MEALKLPRLASGFGQSANGASVAKAERSPGPAPARTFEGDLMSAMLATPLLGQRLTVADTSHSGRKRIVIVEGGFAGGLGPLLQEARIDHDYRR